MKVYENIQNFNESITSGVTVVDVFATWCGPCKILAPVFEEVAEELGDQAEFWKLDIDIMPEIAEKFAIMTVPTILVFQNGEVVEQVSAILPKDSLKELVTKHL